LLNPELPLLVLGGDVADRGVFCESEPVSLPMLLCGDVVSVAVG
jgi:hypothetical protein